MSRRQDRISPPYLAAARRDNPGASEEVIQEAARRLQEACIANANAYLARKYRPGTYRPLGEKG